MIRDMERLTAERVLPFRMPHVFPAHSVAAARAILAAIDLQPGGEAGLKMAQAIFIAQFGRGDDIAETEVLRACAREAGLNADAVAGLITAPEIKLRLRENTDEAAKLGIFGAPTIRTPDGDLFWGDDRLEAAIAWADRN
ncbi:MAG: DsbA family protein, partial [Pseudomonadota bacterium]